MKKTESVCLWLATCWLDIKCLPSTAIISIPTTVIKACCACDCSPFDDKHAEEAWATCAVPTLRVRVMQSFTSLCYYVCPVWICSTQSLIM